MKIQNQMNDIFIEKIKNFAINQHAFVNHYYDGESYSIHLNAVVQFAKKYLYLIPSEDQSDILCACYCHDLIEDARLTYNDVLKITNERIANITYALTNEKGKTRKERANDKYYRGIRETEYAVFVKICDRLANTLYSKNSGSTMFNVYKKENPYFESQLKIVNPDLNVMFTELQNLFI